MSQKKKISSGELPCRIRAAATHSNPPPLTSTAADELSPDAARNNTEEDGPPELATGSAHEVADRSQGRRPARSRGPRRGGRQPDPEVHGRIYVPRHPRTKVADRIHVAIRSLTEVTDRMRPVGKRSEVGGGDGRREEVSRLLMVMGGGRSMAGCLRWEEGGGWQPAAGWLRWEEGSGWRPAAGWW